MALWGDGRVPLSMLAGSGKPHKSLIFFQKVL